MQILGQVLRYALLIDYTRKVGDITSKCDFDRNLWEKVTWTTEFFPTLTVIYKGM